MKSDFDAVLEEQAAAFRLRFGCEDCAHFAEESSLCSLEYPNEQHRADAPPKTRVLVFCKEFDLA